MAPRKKAAKKSNQNPNQNHQNSQPSKFGIQHFFDRHTQNSLSQNPKPIIPNPDPLPSTSRDPPVPPSSQKSDGLSSGSEPRNGSNSANVDSKDVVSGPVSFRDEVHLKVKDTGARSSQNTPDENLIPVVSNVVENQLEVSPAITKSVSVKRFKFSPGMVIKQSQDDGGEAVTWKISPVNERLHAVSKHLPDAMRVLADSSRVNTMRFQQCSQNKNSADSAFQLDKWLSSPPLKATGNFLMLSNGNRSEKADSNHDMDLHGNNENATDKNNNGMVKSQSPFTTPPSLSYCHDKPADGVHPNVVSDLLGSRQHKKALLDLLDQVEDVISVEELACKDTKVLLSSYHDRIGNDKHVKSDLSMKGLGMRPAEKVSKQPSNPIFLVLEVSEKQPVASAGPRCPFKVLRLLNEQSGEERAVHLLDEWFESVIAPGDTVHVIGEFDEQGKCDVSHDSNFLIVHPDILVSGTRVASSFTCPRRTVLDERLKGGEHSAAALIGTLLHQIFQAGLIREFPTKEFLEEYARVLLQKNIEGLYACGVNEGDTHKTLMEAIPRLLSWVIHFRDTQGPRTPSVDFGSDHGVKKVEVSEVMDIEEMAWAPKYGLKGMIDASLRVKVASNGIEAKELIMPLEFKSGKATSGQTTNEHRAQVMLYTLLMSERYQNRIDSGLLYYLHTDQTQGVVVRRSDLLGLIMRRNELANDILKASTTQLLPPMLRIPNMCKSCRHLNVCTIYHKAHGGCTETSGLGDMYDSLINHLTDVHGLFLEKWDRLIDLEAKELETVRKEIWSHSEKRANSASCISSIVLDTSDKVSAKSFEQGSRFSYRFVRQDLPPPNKKTLDGDPLDSASSSVYDLDSSLKTGDYVILSTESDCLVVASGVIMDISRSHVTVSFSKRLRLPGGSRSVAQDLYRELWRIDKDEFLGSFAIMRFNLIQLFLQNEESSHLRRMIVDLEAPRYDNGCIFSQDPAVSYIWSEKNLNDDQRTTILKILTAKDYTLVLGMPGTGKTSTMVHAVKALLMRGSSILLTSYTNSAVDNLLVKLKAQGIDFIRIGRDDAVHEEIRGHCISAMDMRSIEDIKLKLDQTKVVAVTCLGITSPLLANKRFDVCIMDEAGQTTLPVSLGPLLFASMFVLVGDHYQLPPLVKSAEARENGMAVSLFCRLSEAHPQAISALQSQYRMCASIMKLSNGLIYGNRLRCGSPEIENAKLKYRSLTSLASWLKEVLDPDRPVIFINTDFLPAFEVKDGKSVCNPIEAYIVSEVTETLVHKGIRSEDIGIITPYNSQTNSIRQAAPKSVEINTIDKYQGRDKDCILVSFVRSSNNPRSCIASLLGDWHRINVALTRAKKKLVMVGSCRTLSKVPLLKLLIEKVEEQSGILSVSNKDINPKGELKRCSHSHLIK